MWILQVKMAIRREIVCDFEHCLATASTNAVFKAGYGGPRLETISSPEPEDAPQALEAVDDGEAKVLDFVPVAVKMSLEDPDDSREERVLERVRGQPGLQQLVWSRYFPELRAKVLVTEFVDASTKFIADSLAAAQSYTSQLLAGIARLHALSLIHRDIKDDNVVFDGARQALVIIDFDSAFEEYNIADPSAGELPLGRIGTPGYFAPEVQPSKVRSSDRVPYNHKVDVWSAGILLGNKLLASARTEAGDSDGGDDESDDDDDFLGYQEIVKRMAYVSRWASPDSPLLLAVDLLDKLLTRNPNRRIEAAEALVHPFLVLKP